MSSTEIPNVTVGDRVVVRANSPHRLSFLCGREGTVIEKQPHQFDDETAVQVDGYDSFYYVPTSLLEPAEKSDKDCAPSSFHFFEVLLDSVEEAHPSSKLFYNELISAGLLHAQKQRDYGKPGDPFANVRSTEEWGIPPWVGAMVRLNDKVKRLQALARTGGLANESAVDSFRDIAVYALIALVLYAQESEAGEAGEAPLARGASA